MKILLIVPPASILRRNIKNSIPPLGIAYLGACLLREGFEVRLLDCIIEGFHHVERLPGDRIRFGLSNTQISDIIRREAPDVVGVSCLFSQQGEMAKEVLRIAKATRPEATTIFGGLHPTLFPEDALSERAADIVFRGMGEGALPGLLRVLQEGGTPAGLPGVVTRDANGGAVAGPEAPFPKDLDAIPFPAFHLLPIEKYLAVNFPHGGHVIRKRVMPILSSRGCPCRCTYCDAAVFWGNRIAYRSAQNVVNEIRMLREDYQIGEIHFEDDNLILNRKRAFEIFHLMATQTPGLKWNVPNGITVAHLDGELLEAMASSGCYEVTLAVESGSERVLTDILGRTDYLARVPEIVRVCKRLGIFVHGTFMVGLPGETLAEAKRTIDAPFRFGFDDATMVTWVPIPGTKLYETAVEEGIIRPEDVGFERVHMTARVPRRTGVPLELLWKLIARAMWRIRWKLLRRNPRLFYGRFIRPFVRNPGFGVRYVLDQLFMSIRPKISGAS